MGLRPEFLGIFKSARTAGNIRPIFFQCGWKHWMLDGGSLLGSVRHMDIIPWASTISLSVPLSEWMEIIAVLTRGGKTLYSASLSLPSQAQKELKRIYIRLGKQRKSCINHPFSRRFFVDVRPARDDDDKALNVCIQWMELPGNKAHGFGNIVTRVFHLVHGWLTRPVVVPFQPYCIFLRPRFHQTANAVFYPTTNTWQSMHHIYPPQLRPLGDLMLPVPRSPLDFLVSLYGTLNLALGDCVNTRYGAIQPCKKLAADRFPMVLQRRQHQKQLPPHYTSTFPIFSLIEQDHFYAQQGRQTLKMFYPEVEWAAIASTQVLQEAHAITASGNVVWAEALGLYGSPYEGGWITWASRRVSRGLSDKVLCEVVVRSQ